MEETKLGGDNLTNACSRQSRLSHLVLAHKLRQPRLQLKPTLEVQVGESIRFIMRLVCLALFVSVLLVNGAVLGATLDLSFDLNTPASHERSSSGTENLDIDAQVAFSIGLFSSPLFDSSRGRLGLELGRQGLSVRPVTTFGGGATYTAYNVLGRTDVRIVGTSKVNLSAGVGLGLSFLSNSIPCNELFCNLPGSVTLVAPSVKLAVRLSSKVSGFFDAKGSVYLTDRNSTFPYKSGAILAIGIEFYPEMGNSQGNDF